MIVDALRSDQLAKQYIDKALDFNLQAPFCGYVFVNEARAVVGAFILNGYESGNVELTVASHEKLTIRAVRFMVYLAFHDLKCNRITARTRASNKRAINAILKSGAKQEGVLRGYFNGEDAIVFGLLASEQKLVRK